jgi:hypothetical protein
MSGRGAIRTARRAIECANGLLWWQGDTVQHRKRRSRIAAQLSYAFRYVVWRFARLTAFLLSVVGGFLIYGAAQKYFGLRENSALMFVSLAASVILVFWFLCFVIWPLLFRRRRYRRLPSRQRYSTRPSKAILVLKRVSTSRAGGPWSNDDYDVFDGNRHIGRIMLHPQAPEGHPWFWIITAHPRKPSSYDHGYAASREQAMADFKARWLK